MCHFGAFGWGPRPGVGAGGWRGGGVGRGVALLSIIGELLRFEWSSLRSRERGKEVSEGEQSSWWELLKRKAGKEVHLEVGLVEEQLPKMMFNIQFLVSSELSPKLDRQGTLAQTLTRTCHHRPVNTALCA